MLYLLYNNKYLYDVIDSVLYVLMYYNITSIITAHVYLRVHASKSIYIYIFIYILV